ncbi:type I-C CRISPR-associated protein Cas7/Csd2 [Catenisphaera adipataccumulans]|jgi:CRISPR-associated protein Csd2|uniref:CRISPR-associated protein Csd2 n=1 Tax=Catenisphaera adipataccumulans TaxID=700500 RepID=A0A7W8D0R7_9FIRM|nr:type I-C CRISPR-associated protein Cas7/Csd2 [Catenisphaera adipataccumulans]MBB5183948.1 CRISPR-associated protein Csd2 [Catenisphaera adipataccumulans]
MTALQGKIDFVLLVSANNANPNGDPLNGNRPRETYDGRGEISDVCIKRKIRNRFQDLGQKVFVQSTDRSDDGCTSLSDRAKKNNELKKELDKKKNADVENFVRIACKEWIDVRTFGQVFAFGEKKSEEKGKGISIGVRGPVTIQQAISTDPVDIVSMQITKSVNNAEGKGKAPDTMGKKHFVDFGLYIVKGSVNVQLAEKTGFSQEDADVLKEALKTLFENDESSARPAGSMEVCELIWWQHKDKTPKVSTAKVHRSVHVKRKDGVEIPHSFDDYEVTVDSLSECVEPEVIVLV